MKSKTQVVLDALNAASSRARICRRTLNELLILAVLVVWCAPISATEKHGIIQPARGVSGWAFSPDEKLLATFDSFPIGLLVVQQPDDPPRPMSVGSVTIRTRQERGAFSPDGKILVTVDPFLRGTGNVEKTPPRRIS